MNRIFSLLACASLSLSAMAQQDTLSIGFCNGEVATATEHKMDGKCWNEAAVYLPKSVLSAYKGNVIAGVRAGLVNVLNTDSLITWVRSEKDGKNISSALVIRKTGKNNVVKGWNKLVFDKPYTITGDEDGLYIGYSIRQKASVEIISTVGSQRIGTSYIKQGTYGWKDISLEGVLSIEALVTGGNMPKYDLGIASATIVPAPSVSPTALKVTLSVHNYGTKTVDGFTLSMAADNLGSFSSHISQTLESTAEANITYTVDPGVANDGDTKWTINLTDIDNATDCNAENNSTTPFYTYIKNVLLEEFTTEKCSNCPTAAANIHTLLEDKDVSNVIVVAHHVGYYTDWLTLPGEEGLLWFYNYSENYAPAAMVNRKAYFTTKSDEPTPVFLPTNYSLLKACITSEAAQSTNAMLSVDLDKSSGAEVKVNVSGICNSLYSASNPYIMVYLIENELKAKGQEGATGTYFQQHVTRACNGIWGEPVTWNGKSFSYQTSFSIDPAWNKKNMEVVAFVYNYNKNDIKDCAIENAASIPLEKNVTAISLESVGETHEVARYAADGRRVDSSHKGLTIVKLSNGSTVKELTK